MELLINLYQENADHALVEMQRAMREYEDTQDSDCLMLSLEWEIKAHYYLNLAEQALEDFSCCPKGEKAPI